VQVGNDSGVVDSWMQTLDDGLQTLDDGLKAKGAKFDIVDVMGISQTKGMPFAENYCQVYC
jgi:X-X-X-Leu-X-X-Gly heptad repeat protein